MKAGDLSTTVRTLNRFPDEEEADFVAWHAELIRPLCLFVARLGIAIYVILPFLTSLALREQTPDGIWLGELVVNPLPLIAWMVLLSLHSTRRYAVLWTALTQILVFAGTVYVVYGVFGVHGGGVVYIAMFFAVGSSALRLSFRATVLTTTLINGAAFTITARDVHEGLLTLKDAWPSFTFLLTALVGVSFAALLTEATLRRTWSQDRLIESQQQNLLESRRLIRRYLPPAVAESIESGDAPTIDTPVRRRVTVLFSDVVEFTALADRLDPESLTEVINDYLGAVADIIEAHGGTLNEFAGDGFMAVFGAPRHFEPEDQLHRALAASIAIQQAMPRLNDRWSRLGLDQTVQTRIGINTGMLSVGTFGSQGRATYTAIGLQTNIAARIQAHCEPGGILLSKSSWNLVKGTIACEPRGQIVVKGVHFPIELYAPSVEE